MKALLVIDVQNDFCSGGALEVREGDAVVPVINNLIDLFTENCALIVATQDYHPQEHKSFASSSGEKIGTLGELNGLVQVWWPDHCVSETHGAEFHRELKKIQHVIRKGTDIEIDSYSGFFDNGRIKATELDALLKTYGITTLFIAGLATDYCVKYTVLDAIYLGYQVYLVEDGCRGVNLSPGDSQKAIEEMKKAGAKTVFSSDIKTLL